MDCFLFSRFCVILILIVFSGCFFGNALIRSPGEDFFDSADVTLVLNKRQAIQNETERKIESEVDAIPMMAAFKKTENSFSEVLDANRMTGIEPYQGDIDLDDVDKKVMNETQSVKTGRRRNVLVEDRKLWRSKTIPYVIDFSRVDATRAIRKSMDVIEKVSCLKFRTKKPGDTNWLKIYRGMGCHSGIGRKFWATAPTDLSLGRMCIQESVIVHELLHALGFFHEQSRPDRDSFVKIYYENIRSALKSNFDKFDGYEADIQDTDYDYTSLMHYENSAFTKNGKATIQSIFSPKKKLGGRKMSSTDIVELNKLYHCKSTSKTWSDWGAWSPCQMISNNCIRIRQRYCFAEDVSLCKGADQYGVADEKEKCKNPVCQAAINGHWGRWSEWSTCSQTCDEGRFRRTRKCDNPKPEHDGKPCKGYGNQTRICLVKKCNSKWYDTSFEDGMGMWKQDKTDDFDWIRSTTGTGTLRTGPKHDHTTGKGYFILIDGTPPRSSGQVARLISPNLPSGFGPKCMTFFYAMSGKHIGYLDVHIKTLSGKFINLWRKNGHQGNMWYNAAVPIPLNDENFQIKIEAQRGNGELSDIAIDDVFFGDGKCPLGVQGCENHNPSCEDWAYMNQCKTNGNWMKKYCCKACQDIGSCRDISPRHCRFWARKGECTRNQNWMWKNCCTACRRCRDKDPKCVNWQKAGECNKNKLWMYRNCRSACGYCK